MEPRAWGGTETWGGSRTWGQGQEREGGTKSENWAESAGQSQSAGIRRREWGRVSKCGGGASNKEAGPGHVLEGENVRAGRRKTEPERWAGLRSWRWSLDRRGGAWANGLALSSEAGPKAFRRTWDARRGRNGWAWLNVLLWAGRGRSCDTRRGPGRGQSGVWRRPREVS